MTEKQKQTVSGDRRQALDAVFAQIDKQYGKGSIMLLGQTPSVSFDAISTGSILIDTAIGIGGLPRGRVIEIYGPEASGKTTLALQVVAEAQKKGGTCAFIDAEHALDPLYAGSIGIDIDSLIISQPDYGEQALEIAEMLIRSAAIDVVVIDSVAALVPKTELDGDMGDQHVGLQARLMSQALRKLTPVVHKSKTVLIFINQVRQNISAMAFAPKETTTGGKALKFYSSLRIEVRRIESIKDKEGVDRGNRVQVKIAKNKMAPPFKVVVVDLIFGKGISKEYDLLDAALRNKVVQQSGAWFSCGTEKLAQGREAAATALREQPALAEKIRKAVLDALSLGESKVESKGSE
ncbi:MAG: Protein RecA [candidate division TM6 bacterium GW2011_GWE2_42_60]|nr:MAG: Protein RecA [candidate division TM6 bacterium GW2011_GWE2_42_60]HBY06152.1 recombinase RecA [Candidatus Dependentiae bacterium]